MCMCVLGKQVLPFACCWLAAMQQLSNWAKKLYRKKLGIAVLFHITFFSSRIRFAMYISHNDRSCGINTKSEIVEICNGRQYCQENFSMDGFRKTLQSRSTIHVWTEKNLMVKVVNYLRAAFPTLFFYKTELFLQRSFKTFKGNW